MCLQGVSERRTGKFDKSRRELDPPLMTGWTYGPPMYLQDKDDKLCVSGGCSCVTIAAASHSQLVVELSERGHGTPA